MVFSFFRKKDQDDAKGPATSMRSGQTVMPDAGRTGPQGNAAQDKADTAAHFDHAAMAIEVGVGSEMLSPCEEQAVMLHANNQPDAAIAVLEPEIAQVKGKRRLETWLMLFELYQQTGRRQQFDALGLNYVVEFETSPPIWQNATPQAGTGSKGPGSNYFAFGEKLAADTISAEISRFSASFDKSPILRVDFAKVRQIDTLGAAELLVSWQQAQKRKLSLQVLGSKEMASLLSEKIEVGRPMPAEAPFWLLLIELYQALGLQEEFENLAVDYAITYEVSPPSWDSRHAPRTASQVAADEAKAKAEIQDAAPAGSDGELSLSGEITAKQCEALDTIRKHAEGRDHLSINLARVKRIDFESAGMLLNLFMGMPGKTVSLQQSNEMVYGLLRLMGITELVSVSRKKR
ncbi:STAS domain-containing protein [Chitinilyticum piscinae]|uniref:STAS domain-containing protein n=1 Tax=Chitinilyticum piscinae TaxID=2866724 RepID=A0A8J7K129_9NEIS|nr:STAS domain-containing protein [Chitinilyticum piscinae]MBE9608621.1 STAS domain-containing protein [Chitinilyticum piscinae]